MSKYKPSGAVRPNAPTAGLSSRQGMDGDVRRAILCLHLANAPMDVVPRIMLRQMSIYPKYAKSTKGSHGSKASEHLQEDLARLEHTLPGSIRRDERFVTVLNRPMLEAFGAAFLDAGEEDVDEYMVQVWEVQPGTLIQALVNGVQVRLVVARVEPSNRYLCYALNPHNATQHGMKARRPVDVPAGFCGPGRQMYLLPNPVAISASDITDIQSEPTTARTARAHRL